MPRVALTDIALKRLTPPEKGQTTFWDASLPSFGVRLSQGGSKTFVVVNGPSRERTTIGRYPTISLSDARMAAKRVLAERTLRKHRPVAVKFEEALDQYLEDCKRRLRPRTYYEYKRQLERHWLPKFRHYELGDISPHDIHKRLDRLNDRPSEQSHALKELKVFLSWCERRQYLDRSPAASVRRRQREVPRDRVLKDDELITIWNASTSYPFGNIVRLLILTGLRRGEAASLQWSDIEGNAIRIPGERTKNGRTHTLPVTPMVRELIESVPRIHNICLFPARGKEHPFNGWGASKSKLDKACEVENWTLHDLRRTFATNLASLGVQPHVTEQLLNHKTGTVSGVAAIYNRFEYFDDMRDALKRWEERLSVLLT